MRDEVENPCRQDCARRCAGCHAKCPEYLEYQAYRQTVYAARAKAAAAKGPTPWKQARLRQANREKRGGHRHMPDYCPNCGARMDEEAEHGTIDCF